MTDQTTADPREQQARHRPTRDGIREGIARIVESHPSPDDLKNALIDFCDDTARLASMTGWRDALYAMKGGDRLDVMLSAADRMHGWHLDMFSDNPGPATVEAVATRLLAMGVPFTRYMYNDDDEPCGLEVAAHPTSECEADVFQWDDTDGWTFTSVINPPCPSSGPCELPGVALDADAATVASRIRAVWDGTITEF